MPAKPDLLRGRLPLGNRLLGQNLRLGFGATGLRFLQRRGGARLGCLVGDVALLGKFRVLLQAQYLQRLLRSVEILLCDRDLGITHRLVTLLALGFDDLCQGRQTLGVEGIVRIEKLGVGLVELGQRRAFQFETVELKIGGDRGLHCLDEVGTLLLQVREQHRRGDGTQSIDELRLDELTQLGDVVGAIAERLRRQRDRR